jgi:DNA polymerase I
MKFQLLTTEQEVRELIDWHNLCSEFVVLDTEGTDKDPRKAQLVDIQMSGKEPDAAVMFGAQFIQLLGELRALQVWQNFKWDWKVLYRHGLDLRGKPMRDTMLLHHLVDENADHDLDSIVKERWNDDYKAKFWGAHKTYQEAPDAAKIDYGCRDIVYTGRFYRELLARQSDGHYDVALSEHVHRLALALYDTELAGVRIDLDYLTQMGGELKKDVVATEAALRQLGGYHCEALELEAWAAAIQKAYTPKGKKWRMLPKPEFNFDASGQVASLLYDKLGLPPQKNHRTKKLTADDAALERLEGKHPIIPELRKLRKFSKMHGSFVEGVLERAQGDRIYPSFNVNGTVTGRISHSDPNMGQMPSRGEWSKIRGIFVPDPGHVLITCDYSQLEVCIAAHFSQDKNLLRIIHEGASKHDITANGLGISRTVAKTLNFAMQYQCGPKKVGEILGCSPQAAQEAWNKYWETYEGEKAVIDACKRKVDAGQPIVNPFGRRRRFPQKFAERWQLEAAYRQAYSSLIQGTGSEFTSYGFYRLAEWLKATGYGRAWFTVHDEILLQCLPEHVEEVRAKVIEVMTGAAKLVDLRVPLSVQCSGPLKRWKK